MTPSLSNIADTSRVRTFVALELPESLQWEIAALESDFADHAAVLKWTRRENLHVTLKFLGQLPSSRVSEVVDSVREIARSARAFTADVVGIGAFPNQKTPRVLWVGLDAKSALLVERLFVSMEQQLSVQGFERDARRFSPHITLARTRDGIGPGERQSLGVTLRRLQGERTVAGSFEAQHLTVMRSQLSPRGPKYTPIVRARFAG
jgi:RNA 2',3'-cyclic 3'-phosphodiesterase